MKRPKAFILVELLIAISISVTLLLVIYMLYQSEMENFQLNKKRMEAIDKLWLSMDKIKEDVRKGKQFENPMNFPFLISFPIFPRPRIPWFLPQLTMKP